MLQRVKFASHKAFATVAGELYERSSRGATEAGCFVLGTIEDNEGLVKRIVYFDELDPHAYKYGAINFNTATMGPLYDLCERESLDILADIHTHPCKAFQSPIDEANPVVAVAGHIAIVLPYDGRYRTTRQIRAFVLQHDGGWLPHPSPSIDDLLALDTPPATSAEFDRTDLLLLHKQRMPAQRRALLSGISVQVAASAELCTTAAGQAALLTAVALAGRFARGGVYATLQADGPLLIAPEQRLSEAVEMLGAILGDAPRPTASILIGTTGQLVSGFAVRPVASGGEYGCAPATDEALLNDTYEPGVVLAAAMSVGEIFRRFVLGKIEAVARRRSIRLFTQEERSELPADLSSCIDAVWLAGFGHLGNAYAWCMAMTPGLRPDLLIHDKQRVDLANAGTQLFITPADVNGYKVDIAKDQLERLGFRVRVDRRELDERFEPFSDAPPVIIAGFDNVPARRALSRSHAEHIIDGGLGSTMETFSCFALSIFFHPSAAIDAFADEGYSSNAEALLDQPAFAELDTGETARCGLLYALADTAIAVPFVGLTVAPIAITTLIRLKLGFPQVPEVSGDALAPHPLKYGAAS